MRIERVPFANWLFEVDRELTVTTYKLRGKSGAEECGCDVCTTYLAHRDRLFPAAILDLFIQFGIDYKKEAEVYSYQSEPVTELHGWFHFAGRIIAGPDCGIALSTEGSMPELTAVDDSFEIGFTIKSDLSFFQPGIELVQVEFTALPRRRNPMM